MVLHSFNTSQDIIKHTFQISARGAYLAQNFHGDNPLKPFKRPGRYYGKLIRNINDIKSDIVLILRFLASDISRVNDIVGSVIWTAVQGYASRQREYINIMFTWSYQSVKLIIFYCSIHMFTECIYGNNISRYFFTLTDKFKFLDR